MRISVIVAAAATAIVFSASISAPARADAKGEFQKGCESGGGSYGEDVNGVFCNSSGGMHIACNESITHCTATSYTSDAPPKRHVFRPPTVGLTGITAAPPQTAPSGPKAGGQVFRAPVRSLGVSRLR
jgi:hypothetical protein